MNSIRAAVDHQKTCIDTQTNNKRLELFYNCDRRQEFLSQSFIVRVEFFKTFVFISFLQLYISYNFAYGMFSLVDRCESNCPHGLFGRPSYYAKGVY